MRRFSYRPAAGVWDEMFAADGSVRPHWQAFAAMLQKLGVGGMQDNAATIARLLRDHGVTYMFFRIRARRGGPGFSMPCLCS